MSRNQERTTTASTRYRSTRSVARKHSNQTVNKHHQARGGLKFSSCLGSPGHPHRALSHFDPNRKKQDHKKKKASGKDYSEDAEAKLRIKKTGQSPGVKVFLSFVTGPAKEHRSPLGDSETTLSELTLHNSDDGYSPTLHLKHVMGELGGHKEAHGHSKDKKHRKKNGIKRAFNPKVLGQDETEFHAKKLHQHLGGYLPEDIKMPHEHPKPRRSKSTKCCQWSNCGACYCLKIFIVATLVVATLMYLSDPCYPVKDFFISSKKKHDAKSHGTVKPNARVLLLLGGKTNFGATAGRANGSLTTSWLSSKSPSWTRNATSTETTLLQTRPKSNLSRSWRFNATTRENASQVQPVQLSPIMSRSALGKGKGLHGKEQCGYKTFYIIWMALGVLLYLSICVVYSCGLVVMYYDFPWFLLEAVVLIVHSLVLFSGSIAGFILKGELESTVLGLVNSFLGIMVGLWNYGNHRAGLTPMESITYDDPDQNLVSRIMGSKQISKMFSFNKTDASQSHSHSLSLSHLHSKHSAH